MAKMAPANMYRVGDYVYFEANSGCPYQIRRIEELNKTSTGNVEAKVMCFFRRRDISVALLAAFNRCSRSAVTEENASDATGKTEAPAEPPPPADETPFMPGQENLNSEEKHLLTHRELFLSRQIEVLPATHIRGKCSVALLNEVETPDDYLKREDAFFYSLIYDPDLRTLVADKGEIRIGEDYQAVIPECIGKAACEAENTRKDVLMFDNSRCVSETLLDQYLVIARAVGTFARALDMNTLVKIPSLHMCAASAVRDVTTQQAMNMLHQADYDIGKAVLAFVPMPNREAANSSNDKSAVASGQAGGPLMARDQLEEWSAAEANLFEEALEKYGKDFNDIRSDFLPWKGLRNIVEYYYMYKTTDRYVQQKRAKAAEAESRLKQVYIPTYTKPNPNIISSNPAAPALCCESCKTNASDQWYAWGPVSLQMRLCKDCWSYWKRYGGLKMPHKYENYDRTTGSMTSEQAPGGVQNASKLNGRSGNEAMRLHVRRDHTVCANGVPTGGGRTVNTVRPSNQPKTRSSIYLQTSLLTKVARRLAPKHTYNPRHHARHPCEPISSAAIAQHCQSRPWKEIQNMMKVICRGSRNDARAASAVPTPGPSGGGGGGGTHSKRRKRYLNSPGEVHAKRVRKSEVAVSDYASWKAASDGCMFVTKALKQLRQKLTSGQVHRLARNPFKESKALLSVVGGADSGGAEKATA